MLVVAEEGEGAGSECGVEAGIGAGLECGVEDGAGIEFGEIAGLEEL